MELHKHLRVVALALGIGAFPWTWAAGTAAIQHAPPGGDFKPVSKLVALPDYLPGMGTLYVNPSTLPVGPFLGYDHSGRLVNVIYMVPVKDIEKHKSFEALGAGLGDLKVDHTDVTYNPGHPGVEEPHYHIVEWLIGRNEQLARMK